MNSTKISKEYRNLAEYVSDMIQCFDENGNFTYVNKSWKEKLGYSEKEMKTITLWDIIHPEAIEHCQKVFQLIMAGKTFDRLETVFITKFGDRIHVEGNTTCRHDDAGKVISMQGIFREITEQIEKEAMYVQLNHLTTRLSQQMPGALYQYQLRLDGSSFFPFASDGIWDIYECTSTEVKDDASKVFTRIHTEDYDRVVASIQHSADQLNIWDEEYRVNLPDKGQRWVRGTARPEKLSDRSVLWHGYLQDITEEKKTEEKLEQQLNFHRMLVEISSDFLTANAENHDEKINRMLQKVGEFFQVDRTYLSNFQSDNNTITITHEWCADGNTNSLEHVQRNPVKSKSLLSVPIIENEQCVGILGIDFARQKRSWQEEHISYLTVLANVMVDARTKVKAEKELLKINEELHVTIEESQRLAVVAEEANEAKSEFLANMSHEIRTPMNAILGMTEVLKENVLKSESKKYLQIIKNNGENLLRIINDILDISKIESGKLEIHHESFSPWHLLQDIQAIFSTQAEKKGIEVRINTEISKPEQYNVFTDRDKLRQILINLVGNAIKFTHQGNVSIHLDQCVEAKEGLRFIVSDTGIGINENNLDKIFDSFQQGESGTSRTYGGSGLGLTISRELAKMLEGRLYAESQVGSGSQFYLEIPCQKADISQLDILIEDSQQNGEKHETPRLNVLLVEDNEDNRLLIKVFLKEQPLTIDIATNGQQAVKRFMEKGNYDLILMDVQMPVMDGLDATREIRRIEKEKQLPAIYIVALTAYAMREDTEKSKLAGCNEHISKPVKKKQLIELLQRIENK